MPDEEFIAPIQWISREEAEAMYGEKEPAKDPVFEPLFPTPEKTNGMTFIAYTIESGGIFKLARAFREQYDEAVSTGRWDASPIWGDQANMVRLNFILFLRVEDNHDFLLGCSRA